MLFRSNDTATTEIYTQFDTLSLHDALPIWPDARAAAPSGGARVRVPPPALHRIFTAANFWEKAHNLAVAPDDKNQQDLLTSNMLAKNTVVRRGAAAGSRGEPENPGIGLGDPERGS